jgi:hypothetical protein
MLTECAQAAENMNARIAAVTRGLGIKIKWPSTGADGGVLRAWWCAKTVGMRQNFGSYPLSRSAGFPATGARNAAAGPRFSLVRARRLLVLVM